MPESMETISNSEKQPVLRLNHENWINKDQSRQTKVTPDLQILINGDWRNTMAKLRQASEIGKYVETLDRAKDMAVVWLGLTQSNKYTPLLHTLEMEAMLKDVFKLKD